MTFQEALPNSFLQKKKKNVASGLDNNDGNYVMFVNCMKAILQGLNV